LPNQTAELLERLLLKIYDPQAYEKAMTDYREKIKKAQQAEKEKQEQEKKKKAD
jgi:hypothetical protein